MSEDRRMPPRYGFDVNGYARQMYDGYWTPWHIAKDEITALRAEVERQRQQLAYLGGTVEVLSLSEQKLKAKLSARDAEVRALREEWARHALDQYLRGVREGLNGGQA